MNRMQKLYTGMTFVGAALMVLITMLDLFYRPIALGHLIIPTLMFLIGLGLLAWESDGVDVKCVEDEQ